MNTVRPFLETSAATFVGGILALIVFRWLTNRTSTFAEYVPSIEGFERMDLQSPDAAEFHGGERA